MATTGIIQSGKSALEFAISGDKELQRMFAGLTPAVQRKILRPALRAAAKIVLADAKRLAPVDTGLLKKSLKVRTPKKKKRGTIAFLVQTAAGDYKGETFYGSFIELGYKRGKRPGKREKQAFGDQRKEVPRKPYLRPALENNRQQLVSFISAELRKDIPLVAKGLAGTPGKPKKPNPKPTQIQEGE